MRGSNDGWVLAVEPSATMRAQRPATAAYAINARAEALPLNDLSGPPGYGLRNHPPPSISLICPLGSRTTWPLPLTDSAGVKRQRRSAF